MLVCDAHSLLSGRTEGQKAVIAMHEGQYYRGQLESIGRHRVERGCDSGV